MMTPRQRARLLNRLLELQARDEARAEAEAEARQRSDSAPRSPSNYPDGASAMPLASRIGSIENVAGGTITNVGDDYEDIDHVAGNIDTYFYPNPHGQTLGTPSGQGGVAAGNGLGRLGFGLGLGPDATPRATRPEGVPRIRSIKNYGQMNNVGNTHKGGSLVGGNVTCHYGTPPVPVGGRRQ